VQWWKCDFSTPIYLLNAIAEIILLSGIPGFKVDVLLLKTWGKLFGWIRKCLAPLPEEEKI